MSVTATLADSAASLEFQDGGGVALADADSNKTGQQVSLDVGANVIRIEVTSSYANTTATYTLVVTRAALTVSVVADVSSVSLRAGTCDDGDGRADGDASYTLTRTGGLAAEFTVAVKLEQDRRFLPNVSLEKEATFAAGDATTTITIPSNEFQRLPTGDLVANGTLTATVQRGTGCAASSTPAEIDVVIALTVVFGVDAYSVIEDSPGVDLRYRSYVTGSGLSCGSKCETTVTIRDSGRRSDWSPAVR